MIASKIKLNDNTNEVKKANAFFFGAKDATPFFSPTTIQPKLIIGAPNDKYEQEADAMADKVVSMTESTAPVAIGSPSVLQTKCAQKASVQRQSEEELGVQRQTEEEESIQTKPLMMKSEGGGGVATPALTSQLNSSKGGGSPLPASTQFMSNAFGSDLSGVRVHTGSKAIQMNQGLNARAFTHRSDVYFNKGQYSPSTSEGKHLLAHELTHVVQQNGVRKKSIQRITCITTTTTPPARATSGQSNRLDQTARNIISIATNTQYTNVQKASRLITAIICHYYPQHAGLVRNISYVATTAGLVTTSVGRGNRARGDIEVGDYFIQHTTSRGISRRILQVGHELRHILQYRRGLTGRSNRNEREFLAFHENALADEFIGTGRMSRGTRRNLIDAALGYYYCLSQQKQTQYATQEQSLLTKRQQINQRAGSGSTNAPTTCAHP